MLQLSKIADLDIQLIDGDRGENYPSRDEFYENEYCLFLDANNITSNGFDFSTTHFITKEKDSKLRNGKLQRNDIVIMTRGSVGNIAFYDNSIMYSNIRINSGMLIIRCGKSISPLNVYYQFKSPIVLKQINDFMSGSVQKQLPVSILKEIKIFTCSKNNANFLKLIDDKIALNNKTNTELENMAKTIYDYWFSQFDFPDKNSHPYKTSGGQMVYNEILKREIPAGWEVGKLSDIAEFSTETTNTENIQNYITTDNILPNKQGITKAEYIPAYGNVLRYEEYDILIANIRPYFKKIWLSNTNGMCSNDVLCIKAKNSAYKFFLYRLLWRDDFFDYVLKGAKGSKMPRGDKNHIMAMPIVFPNNEDIIESFDTFFTPLQNQIWKNQKEAEELTKLRDYLLPLLMNGQIEVK